MEAVLGQTASGHKVIRIGIIGTGRIAKRFVPESRFVDGIEIAAVYNPHGGSAERFVEEAWDARSGGLREAGTDEENAGTDRKGTVPKNAGRSGRPEVFDGIGAFWQEIDAVYIASPHGTHYSYIMQALGHGKHVLCEKPMVLSSEEAQEAFLAAKNRGLVLMEAVKTAYCPGYKKLLEAAASGVIGEVKYIESRFTKLEDPDKRELTDTECGGSFTELGSYACLPVLDLLGSGYNGVRFSRINNDKGIDIFTKAEFTYADRFAAAVCGLGVKAEGSLMVSGTKGYIKADAPWWKTGHFEVHFEDPAKAIPYDEEFEGDGLRYEISEFVRRIKTVSFDDKYNSNDEMRAVCMADLMEESLKGRGRF